MNKTTLTILATLCFSALAFAEPIKVSLPTQALQLINTLASLDGYDRVIADDTGKDRVVHVPYDFGKDSVRIRLAIRKDLLELRTAVEVYETTRIGYVKQVFGRDSLTPEEFAKQPEAKKEEINRLAGNLNAPVTIDAAMFKPSDVEAFAAAAIPQTTSVALDLLVEKQPTLDVHIQPSAPPKK